MMGWGWGESLYRKCHFKRRGHVDIGPCYTCRFYSIMHAMVQIFIFMKN